MTKKPHKIYVAMSGGVDSSVAAALLKDQGHDVTGVYFKPWTPHEDQAYCDWKQDRLDAMTVATKLDIPFETWDLSKEYGKAVADYMIDSYRNGLTPNPDVLCNRDIKFGVFMERALKEGAEMIATGHYARITEKENEYQLLKGKDQNKDQSYFLWALNQEQLSKSLFPIGEYTKSEIREIAKEKDLITHNKKDSQGVCFVGQLDMKTFLQQFIEPKQGDIVLQETDETIGTHEGVMYFTIGQRHGMAIDIGGGPYFVVAKDIKKNILYVTKDEKQLEKNEFDITQIQWTGTQPEFPFEANVKIRYLGEEIACTIEDAKKDKANVILKTPVSAVAPGQFAVFYKDSQVLGGGVIT